MITPAYTELAFSLTKHYFGEQVAQIVKVLFHHDQASLRTIKSNFPAVKLSEIKKSLLILVKYQLVDYVKTVKNFNHQFEYSVVPLRVFSFFRIPRFIQQFTGKEGSHVGAALFTVAQRALIDKEKLIQILRQRIAEKESISDDEISAQSNIILERLVARKYLAQAGNNVCLSIERLSREHRDTFIIDTISKFYSQESKIRALVKALIDISFENTVDNGNLTAPVPLLELETALVPESFQDKKQLERCLTMLAGENNNRFVVSSGLHPVRGPMFAVNLGSVTDYLVKEYISSIITSRFGPKCCRVFKVLLHRGPLLLKQVEELIMLPARDVREYSYMLIKEGFLRNRQVPKTTDHAPSKSVFIMYIELDRVVYEIADLCCRSINNLMRRYEHEIDKNKLLLDRSKAVRELIAGQEEQDEATNQATWQEYFNSHELSQLEAVDKILNKILIARTQVDETLFLLHVWLEMRPDQVEDPCY